METLKFAGAVIGYLSKKLSQNKNFDDFTSDFASATIDWIRPLFLKDDNEEDQVLKDLKSDPEDSLFQEAAKIRIATFIKKNPEFKKILKELVSEIESKEGAMTSGYNVIQTHSGTGDNIGRDKIVGKN